MVYLIGASLGWAAPRADLAQTLKRVEDRYNSVKTLELQFEQTYVAPNKARRVESGFLQLRKPGRMRWEYTKPDGKLFISNGKDYWYYSVLARRAEKMKLKEAEDIQAPLAFLIGRLDFQRDFSRLEYREERGVLKVSGEPKNLDKSPFRRVAFSVAPDARITELEIDGQDGSKMSFRFDKEVRNPSVDDAIFTFKAPPGVEVVQAGEDN